MNRVDESPHPRRSSPLKLIIPRSAPAIAVITTVVLLAGAGGAVAGSPTTSAQTRDESTSITVGNHTVRTYSGGGRDTSGGPRIATSQSVDVKKRNAQDK